MADSAPTGTVIFAKDAPLLGSFYRQVLEARELHSDEEHIVLQSPDVHLVIHAIPAHIARTIEVASPPEPREDAAIKPFFTVPNIGLARGIVERLGGITHGQRWQGQGYSACDVMDPEGNIFQLREGA